MGLMSACNRMIWTMKTYAKSTDLSTHPVIAPRHNDFARDLAASEFGGKYWGWREWAGHVDSNPDEITEKRLRAIWGGAK